MSYQTASRRRYDPAQAAQMRLDSLDRAENGQSFTNYPAIFEGFRAMGIADDDIKPRENVLTFNAWRAKGRTVTKGQHGVRVVTYIERDVTRLDGSIETVREPHSAVVFHISQTAEWSDTRSDARSLTVNGHRLLPAPVPAPAPKPAPQPARVDPRPTPQASEPQRRGKWIIR